MKKIKIQFIKFPHEDLIEETRYKKPKIIYNGFNNFVIDDPYYNRFYKNLGWFRVIIKLKVTYEEI